MARGLALCVWDSITGSSQLNAACSETCTTAAGCKGLTDWISFVRPAPTAYRTRQIVGSQSLPPRQPRCFCCLDGVSDEMDLFGCLSAHFPMFSRANFVKRNKQGDGPTTKYEGVTNYMHMQRCWLLRAEVDRSGAGTPDRFTAPGLSSDVAFPSLLSSLRALLFPSPRSGIYEYKKHVAISFLGFIPFSLLGLLASSGLPAVLCETPPSSWRKRHPSIKKENVSRGCYS
jgi:hypothetical protein